MLACAVFSPACALFIYLFAVQSWGETKTVRDDLNPSWHETFSIPVRAVMPTGALAKLRLEILDEDNKKRGVNE